MPELSDGESRLLERIVYPMDEDESFFSGSPREAVLEFLAKLLGNGGLT
jgi:hypothetical protein